VATVLDTDANTKLVDAQASTAKSNLPGYYEYEYSGADNLDLVCLFHTSDTGTDQQDLVSYVVEKVYQADAKLDVIDGIVDDILVDTGTTLPAVLDAIKGAGWTSQTLVAIKAAIDEIIIAWTAADISASMTEGIITQIRGNSWDIDITGLTLDSNKQQFAIKETKLEADAQALLLIDTATGLIYLNGKPVEEADQGKASLSYVGTTLTVTVDASITAQLPTTGNYHYGIQSVTAAGVVSESYGGTFTITADTVRATE
jgi:hypothetical protein